VALGGYRTAAAVRAAKGLGRSVVRLDENRSQLIFHIRLWVVSNERENAMKAGCVWLIAGLAVSGACDAQVKADLQMTEFSGEVHRAIRATAIIGMTVDGQYVYGETIELGQGNASRGGNCGNVAYDSAQLADTDGDGFCVDPVCGDTAPHSGTAPSSRYALGVSLQSWAEDIIPDAGKEGGTVSELVFAASRPLCDGGAGTTSEVLQIVLESWEGFDNFPDLDGSDGFDTDADGLGFPASRSDNDGDTFIDEFLGGVILTYANTDTDGDTVPDEMLSSGAGGYGLWQATGLEGLNVPLTSNLDLWDGGNAGTDGRGDGGVRVLWTRGDGGDGMGPLTGGFYPATRVTQMFWGTLAMEAPGNACPYAGDPGFGVGDSDGTIWGEGEDFCGDGFPAWSDGAPSGNIAVDDQFDVTNDIADFNGAVADFVSLGVMFRISVADAGGGDDCCDANNDGACSPADFSAWVAAFNSNGPRCDVNQDGSCTPADFSAWVAAFNASTSGNPQFCTF